jgi:hypothetical protein
MTWVTWHQHRREALVAVLFMAVIAVYLVVTGWQMRTVAAAINLPACSVGGPVTSSCGIVLEQFLSRFAPLGIATLQGLAVVPGLVAVFIGAPLLARELERSTHLLAWTQTITRTRWLVVRLTLVGGATVAAGLLAGQIAAWWWAPLAMGFSNGDWQAFAAIGIMPAAYGVFGLGLGVASGAIVRRTVPAMLITTLGFASTRLAVTYWLRPHYMAPLTGSMDDHESGRWFLGLYWSDAAGHPVANDAVNQLLAQASDPSTVLAEHGLQQVLLYQPASRLLTFQLIEAAIFAGLGLALVAFTVWRARRL